ncbi:hypothetical protein NC651_000158 [Populus alba x Populus x berolinensis]|nr:hypothetical protein NC651_000158 [Populus alba x Populus x berolinensis]
MAMESISLKQKLHKKSSLHAPEDLSLCSRLSYIRTINVYSSCPSDPNAGILLCFIDTSDTCDFGVLFCWLVSELSGVDPSPLLSKSPSLSIWRTSGSNIKLGSGCRIYFSCM